MYQGTRQRFRGFPGNLDRIFEGLNLQRSWYDEENHYSKIVQDMRVDEAGVHTRTSDRIGYRAVDGLTTHVEAELRGSIPPDETIFNQWFAEDLLTGDRLRLELVPGKSAYQNIARAIMPTPKRRNEEFAVRFHLKWPSHNSDGTFCGGVRVDGYTLGVERIKLSLECALGCSAVRLYETDSDAVVLSTQIFIEAPPLLMHANGRSRRFVTEIGLPERAHYFVVWFA